MKEQTNTKVMLIQPPAWCDNDRNDMNPNVPLGISYIGAVLLQEGYDVVMLDAFVEGWDIETRVSPKRIRVGLPFEDIQQRIVAEKPDIVGITSMFTAQRKNMHEVVQRVKNVDNSATISKTFYGEEFISFIEKKNIFGAQFHPEKSHQVGLKLLKNFIDKNKADTIEKIFLGMDFPWYYSENKTLENPSSEIIKK